MVKFGKLFINFVLSALLIVAIFSFGVGLQIDNDVNVTILDSPILNESFQGLKDDLSGIRDQTQKQRELFEKEHPTLGLGSLILVSVVSSGKTFTSIVVGVFNVIFKLPTSLFGLDPLIGSALGGILIVAILLSLWSLYKLGG